LRAIFEDQNAANTLEAAEINFNIAPSWDVYREPGDFAYHTSYSFSNNSDVVDICRSVFIKTQQAASIVSFAKQVPGLGAAGKNENTNEQRVTISSSLKELQSVDMGPYKTAIAAGVDMFIASWAVHRSGCKAYLWT
jgi:beta-glucosidase-like glycosyl hydrolase